MSRIQIISQKEKLPFQTIEDIVNDTNSNVYLAEKPKKVPMILVYDYSVCLYRWVCIEGFQITINANMDFSNIKDALYFITGTADYIVYRFTNTREMFYYIFNEMKIYKQ